MLGVSVEAGLGGHIANATIGRVPSDRDSAVGSAVAGSTCSLLIAGPCGRIALRVPSTVTVAELLAEATPAVGGEAETDASWVLATPRGEALDPERSVGLLGLLDGSLLVLRSATRAEAENIHEDLPEAVAESLESAPGRWSAETAATVAGLFCATIAIGVAAVIWAGWSDLARAAVAFGAGVAVVVMSMLLARAGVLARVGSWTALASLPLFAVGGASAMETFPAGVPAAGAVGLIAGGILVLAAVPGTRSPASGVVAGATVFGVASAPSAAVDLPAAVPPVLVVLLALGLLGLLPRLAVQVAGLLEIDSSKPNSAALVVSAVAEGHLLLAWLTTGTCAALGIGFVALAAQDSPFGLGLIGVATAALLFRARHYSFVAEILPLAALALIGLLAVEVGTLARYVDGPMQPFVAIGIALADGVAIVSIASLADPAGGSLDTRRWLSRLEYAVDAAILPVAIGALGVYDFVFDQAKHLL